METVAVIDFETSGLSPAHGGRATEVAVVLVQGEAIVGRYASLMRSDAWVPPFIEQLTGITNHMLRSAPPAEDVMRAAMRFAEGVPLVAHNAAFDRVFWHAESAQAGCVPDAAHDFACTLLLSRRVHPDAPNHRLGTLAGYHRLPPCGAAHRALADAETTAHLLMQIRADVMRRHAELLDGEPPSHALLLKLQRTAPAQWERALMRHRGRPLRSTTEPAPVPAT